MSDKSWWLHGVWKLPKKSHSTMRTKRATFTLWVGKSWLKIPKIVNFGDFLKTWSLWSNSVTRHVNPSQTIIRGKYQNWKTQMRHSWWFSNTVEFIKKDFLIKNYLPQFFDHFLYVNCVLIFQRLKFSWVQFSCQRINNYRLHLLKIAKIFFCCPFHADWFNIFQLIFFIEKDSCLTINFNFLLPI